MDLQNYGVNENDYDNYLRCDEDVDDPVNGFQHNYGGNNNVKDGDSPFAKKKLIGPSNAISHDNYGREYDAIIDEEMKKNSGMKDVKVESHTRNYGSPSKRNGEGGYNNGNGYNNNNYKQKKNFPSDDEFLLFDCEEDEFGLDDDCGGGGGYMYKDFSAKEDEGLEDYDDEEFDHSFGENGVLNRNETRVIKRNNNKYSNYPYPILINEGNNEVYYTNEKEYDLSPNNPHQSIFNNQNISVVNKQNPFYRDYLQTTKKLNSMNGNSQFNQNVKRERGGYRNGKKFMGFGKAKLNKIPWEDVNCYLEEYNKGLGFIIEMIHESGGQFNGKTKGLIMNLQRNVQELSQTLVQKENEKHFLFDIQHKKKKKRVKHSSCFYDSSKHTFYVIWGKPVSLKAYINSFIMLMLKTKKWGLQDLKFSLEFPKKKEEYLSFQMDKEVNENISNVSSMMNFKLNCDRYCFESEKVFSGPCSFRMKIRLPDGEVCQSCMYHVVGYCDAQFRKKVNMFKKSGYIQKCSEYDLIKRLASLLPEFIVK